MEEPNYTSLNNRGGSEKTVIHMWNLALEMADLAETLKRSVVSNQGGRST